MSGSHNDNQITSRSFNGSGRKGIVSTKSYAAALGLIQMHQNHPGDAASCVANPSTHSRKRILVRGSAPQDVPIQVGQPNEPGVKCRCGTASDADSLWVRTGRSIQDWFTVASALTKKVKDAAKRKLIAPLMIGLMLPVVADSVRLEWEYTPEELAAVDGFQLWWSLDATRPLTNWAIIGTSTTTNIVVDVPKGQHFFAVSVSNYWGRFFFSNITNTPPVPRTNVTLKVIKP